MAQHDMDSAEVRDRSGYEIWKCPDGMDQDLDESWINVTARLPRADAIRLAEALADGSVHLYVVLRSTPLGPEVVWHNGQS